MSKSTPIEAIKQIHANPEEPADDNVKEVLDSINSETYTAPPSMPFPTYIPPPPQYEPMTHDEEEATLIGGFRITNDMKLALISALVFIAIYQIPIEKIVFSYISLDKLPFSEVLIKGLIAGIVFFLLARIIT
jgi:hypothetical protein